MVVAIMQARTGSSRLPKKVLLQVCGKTLLEHEIDRVKRAQNIDKLIIATTTKEQDNPICDIARRCEVQFYRGSEDDVLDRYYQAACQVQATDVVRITGDCPLLDPKIIDRVISFYLEHRSKYSYVSNVRPPTYPDGMDVEIFSFASLEKSWREGRLASEREHVTAYIAKHPEIFTMGNVSNPSGDTSALRLTIDEERDWQLIEQVFLRLYPQNEHFYLQDIVTLLQDNPALREINAAIKPNEGYAKSLANDRIVL